MDNLNNINNLISKVNNVLSKSAQTQQQNNDVITKPYSQNEKIINNVDNNVNEILKTVNKSINDSITSNNALATLKTNYKNVLELYLTYLKKNEVLEEKIKKYEINTTTNDRKTFYEVQNYDILKYWYKIWWWIYFILVITLALGIFLTKSQYSFRYKFISLLLFILYPFVIDYIVLYLLKWLLQLQSFLPKNVYTTI